LQSLPIDDDFVDRLAIRVDIVIRPGIATRSFTDVVVIAGLALEPGGIEESQRIVVHLAVAIVALRAGPAVDERIGRDEPPEPRVIDPPAHVDEVQVVERLVVRRRDVSGFLCVRHMMTTSRSLYAKQVPQA
jgi:hypothetical protein